MKTTDLFANMTDTEEAAATEELAASLANMTAAIHALFHQEMGVEIVRYDRINYIDIAKKIVEILRAGTTDPAAILDVLRIFFPALPPWAETMVSLFVLFLQKKV